MTDLTTDNAFVVLFAIALMTMFNLMLSMACLKLYTEIMKEKSQRSRASDPK